MLLYANEPTELSRLVPATGAVEWVIVQKDLQRQVYGVDLASGAWYRAAYHDVSGWLPSVGVLSGRALRGGVVATKSDQKKSSTVIEHIKCPTVLLKRLLHSSADQREWTLMQSEHGWEITLPLGMSDSHGVPLSQIFTVGLDAKVKSFRRSDENENDAYQLVTFSESPSRFQLADSSKAESKIVFVQHYPNGKTWTREDVERIAIAQRRIESDERRETTTNPHESLAAGQAESSPAVRVESTAKAGPALVLSGVLIGLLGLFIWWRQRS
jgi:hypothetical protein